MEFIEKFLLAFIPLFIAIDPLGLIPLFLGITQGVLAESLRRISRQAVTTAALVSIGFMFLGQLVFTALGITVSDFKVAGGLILLALAYRDLLGSTDSNTAIREDIGVVPLGMPLIAGPATITTLLILVDSVGVYFTLLALLSNLILVYTAFSHSRRISRFIGITGLKAVSKIISLLLAAIAVNMIRKGLQGE